MKRAEAEREAARQVLRMRAGSVDFVGSGELETRLAEALAAGRPLRVKLGLDPSAPDLHLGHTINLEKLRVFQELGHTPIFLVGDFTARIGDPTGRSKTRPALAPEEIKENARTYIDQASRLLDMERAELRYNGEWLDAMKPADFVKLCSHYTVARMLERDDFAKRYREGTAISVHEFLYPLVQAYDSVALEADVELGGTDQLFNLLVGRELQRDYGQPPQAVMTHPLLVGTDGQEKMSKSLGNIIGISDSPDQIYGRTMSISDALMGEWLPQLSFGRFDDLAGRLERLKGGRAGAGEPLALKREFARRLAERFHGAEAAQQAEQNFTRVVQRGELPEDIPECVVELAGAPELGLLELLRRVFDLGSNAEARRLVEQGAVQVDGEPQRAWRATMPPGEYLLRAGKRRYARVRLK